MLASSIVKREKGGGREGLLSLSLSLSSVERGERSSPVARPDII